MAEDARRFNPRRVRVKIDERAGAAVCRLAPPRSAFGQRGVSPRHPDRACGHKELGVTESRVNLSHFARP
jgi:hypothetical protein